MVYYLDVSELLESVDNPRDKKACYNFINPLFEAPNNEKLILVTGQQYKGCCSSTLFQQELTNREKKRMGLK